MLTLEALVASDHTSRNVDWAVVPEWVLHYDAFLGDVKFIVGSMDLSTHWGWVPVLDFALCLSSVLDALLPGSSEFFEFTESEAFIKFTREADTVDIAASYASGSAHVEFGVLREAVREFTYALGHRFSKEHPSLLENVQFYRALNRAGVRL